LKKHTEIRDGLYFASSAEAPRVKIDHFMAAFQKIGELRQK
jgi:hypothetical protein